MMYFGEKDVHIPECEDDNSFKAKQCFKGKCWCVEKDGTNIEGSEVDDGDELDCEATRSKCQGMHYGSKQPDLGTLNCTQAWE